MQTKTIPIKGMHCRSCEVLIKDCLEETPGVESAVVSEKTRSAKVTFDPHKVEESEIIGIIKKCGYEAG